MPEPRIRITIVDDTSGRETCEGNCGVDWSSPEAFGEALHKVAERFGDRARLAYVDLPNARQTRNLAAMKRRIEGMPLPVLLANGKPRIAGEFDTRQLMDVIEADLEENL